MVGPSGAAAPAFDAQLPEGFYLTDKKMTLLADTTLVVTGVCLPAHSAVLSLQSRVLRDMFVDLMSSETSSETSSGRARKQPEEPVVLEQPFEDCRLQDVAAFLRSAYRGSRLDGLPADCLPGVLRLAHRLDAPEIQDAVSARMSKAADNGRATTQELLIWADAADACNLDELLVSCLAAVARRLAADMDSLPAGVDSLLHAITRTSLLKGCSQGRLLQLLSIMTAAGAKPRCIPSKAALGEALQKAPNTGAFEWALERFPEQPAAVGDEVESPWFAAAGKEWRIRVYPGGETDAAAGHLSVFLVPKSATRAMHKLIVVDQSGTASQSVSASVDEPTEIPVAGLGWPKFMNAKVLRTRGFLANDRLVVRAEVEVVPE